MRNCRDLDAERAALRRRKGGPLSRLPSGRQIAVLVGFTGGELFGPDDARAQEPCGYGICYGNAEEQWCQSSANETYCAWSDIEHCWTEECPPPCDPEYPDCTDPPE